MSCTISEHAQQQEKRRHMCVVWLRVDWSHQRQLRGFTTDPLVWREDARQCVAEWRSVVSLGERALW